MDAIILAAGAGNRIKEFHTLPKGLIEIGGTSLISQSIQILRYYDINKILLITGYEANHYVRLFSDTPFVDIIYNSKYKTTDSLYSWYMAKEWVKNDFLLLESDIIYQETAVEKILTSGYPNDILISGETLAGDAVYIETKYDRFIKASKCKNDLSHISGELVGISKFSHDFFREMIARIESDFAYYKCCHYDSEILEVMAKETTIHCTKDEKLLWCEVDDVNQLERARNMYSKIRVNSSILSGF